MEKYRHTVHYYETDRMGFTHHSNYIRWMEEARIHFFDQLGWSYQKFEDEGVISPVTAIECKYKQTTTFPEDVYISVSVDALRGLKLKLKYTMTNAAGVVVRALFPRQRRTLHPHQQGVPRVLEDADGSGGGGVGQLVRCLRRSSAGGPLP